MRIDCWPAAGLGNSSKQVIRVRNIPVEQRKELRAAIRMARDDTGRGELYVLDRGYSSTRRAVARLALGLGVVVSMLAAVAAFLIPDSAGILLGFGAVPAVVVVALTASYSSVHDTGLRIDAGGILRTEGWGGIREIDLRSFARITVANDQTHIDDGLSIAE